MSMQDEASIIRQQCFQRFASRVDIAAVSRTQWRGICRATERAQWQSLLLLLAEAAEAGSQADRLGLYKAAYAVLPLHGQPLAAFVALLLKEWEHQSPDSEWADALLTALAEPHTDPRLMPAMLEALGSLYQHWQERTEDARRARWLAYHVQRLGYHPAWLNTVPSVAPSTAQTPARRRKRGTQNT
jgi:hypothetical protein